MTEPAGGLLELGPARLAALLAEGIGYFAHLVALELEIRRVLDAWHAAGHPDPLGTGAPTGGLYVELNEAIDDASAWFDSMAFLARDTEPEEAARRWSEDR